MSIVFTLAVLVGTAAAADDGSAPSAVDSTTAVEVPAETPTDAPVELEADPESPTLEELGEKHGWEELPAEPESTVRSVAESHAAELAATPRGLILGARLERDVLVWDRGVSLIPALQVAWAGRHLGAALQFVFSRPLGVRVEGRWYPLARGFLRPWLGGGVAVYGADIGVRLAAGATVKVWGPVVVGADAAYESFWKKAPEFTDTLVGVTLFAGVNL